MGIDSSKNEIKSRIKTNIHEIFTNFNKEISFFDLNSFFNKNSSFKTDFNEISRRILPITLNTTDSSVLIYDKYSIQIAILEALYDYIIRNNKDFSCSSSDFSIKHKVFFYFFPFFNETNEESSKISMASSFIYKSLGKHKSIYKFTLFIMEYLYFYSKILHQQLIFQYTQQKNELLNEYSLFYMTYMNDSYIEETYHLIFSHIKNKYIGSIDVIEISEEEIFSFLIKYKITSVNGIFDLFSIAERRRSNIL